MRFNGNLVGMHWDSDEIYYPRIWRSCNLNESDDNPLGFSENSISKQPPYYTRTSFINGISLRQKLNLAIRVMAITYQLGWSIGFSGNQTRQWVIKQFQVQLVPCHFSPSRWSFSNFCCNKPPPFLKKWRFRSGITQCLETSQSRLRLFHPQNATNRHQSVY